MLVVGGVSGADGPVLVVLVEGVLDVVEVAGGDDEDLLVGQVDDLGILADDLQLLPVLVDVAVELPLQLEVAGDGLVGLEVGGELEEVDEDVGLALRVAVQPQSVVGGWLVLVVALGWHLEHVGQSGQLLLEEVVVGVGFAHNVAVVSG